MNTVTASDYINDNFNPQDRLAVVMKFREGGALVQRVATAERIASPRFQAWLSHMNARGANIYVGMNDLKPGAIQRTKENIATIRHLYLDLDENGPQVLQAVLADNRLPKPSYVLSTSPEKYQIIWKVAGFSASQAESSMRSMAACHGADRAATDISRVLRIPGFYNRKYDLPFKVTAERLSNAVHKLSDFSIDLYMAAGSGAQPTAHRTVTPDRISQSERDWAETLRRLSRGENPALVRAALEQKRQDKRNPADYAARTVNRAVAELERRRLPQPALEL